jgi:endoglucanase
LTALRSLLLVCAIAAAVPTTASEFTGVNISGGEFGGANGVHGTNYIFPNAKQIDAFAAMGMNIVRLPVRWERVQPVLGGPLGASEIALIDKVIAAANARHMTVIVDVHNYGRFRGKKLGSPETPVTALPQLWTRLAQHYAANPRVAFGIMNEPIGNNATDWAAIAQATILAIRATGANNLVLVPGAYWTGAHSWTKVIKGVSNADAMTGFNDPANNMAFEMHQYFDANSSGTGTFCVTPTEAQRRLTAATGWLKATGKRGFLGEFGGAATPECLDALRATLAYVSAHREWLGWTAWGSSAWFGSYAFNLFPFQDPPPPQLGVLANAISR